MSGKEAIIDKILSDARAIVNSTLEEANSFCAQEIAIAQNDAKIYREKNMAESYAEREEIIRRKITVANLEVKKLILQAKQELISKAFAAAIDAIKSDIGGYAKTIERMLTLADNGEVVTFSKQDKKLFDEKWLASHTDKKLVFNKNYGDFCGGIVLSGLGSDKNMTLEVELEALRNNYEPQIAEILFGE